MVSMLVVGNCFYVNYSPVAFRFGFPFIEHGGLCIQRVIDKHRVQVFYCFIFQIGDSLTADIRNSHPHDQTKDQSAYHQYLFMLVMPGVIEIKMDWMVVHGKQTKQVVVALKNGFGKGMFYDGPYLKIFIIVTQTTFHLYIFLK